MNDWILGSCTNKNRETVTTVLKGTAKKQKQNKINGKLFVKINKSYG